MIFSTVSKVQTMGNKTVSTISRNYRISKQCCKFLQIFIGLPVAVFVVMGARELLPFFDGLVGNLEVLLVHLKEKQWLIDKSYFLPTHFEKETMYYFRTESAGRWIYPLRDGLIPNMDTRLHHLRSILHTLRRRQERLLQGTPFEN